MSPGWVTAKPASDGGKSSSTSSESETATSSSPVVNRSIAGRLCESMVRSRASRPLRCYEGRSGAAERAVTPLVASTPVSVSSTNRSAASRRQFKCCRRISLPRARSTARLRFANPCRASASGAERLELVIAGRNHCSGCRLFSKTSKLSCHDNHLGFSSANANGRHTSASRIALISNPHALQAQTLLPVPVSIV
jgi:hypothetical protein